MYKCLARQPQPAGGGSGGGGRRVGGGGTPTSKKKSIMRCKSTKYTNCKQALL